MLRARNEPEERLGSRAAGRKLLSETVSFENITGLDNELSVVEVNPATLEYWSEPEDVSKRLLKDLQEMSGPFAHKGSRERCRSLLSGVLVEDEDT